MQPTPLTLESIADFFTNNLPTHIKLESLKKVQLPNGLEGFSFTLWKKDQKGLDCAYQSVRVYPRNTNYTLEITSNSLTNWRRLSTKNFFKWVKKQIVLM